MSALLPIQASAHASQLDTITVLVHGLMAVLLVGWGGFFIYTLVRFRAARNPRASYAGASGRGATWVEIGVVAAELVLLVGFAIPAWATRVRDLPPANAATVVRVVAEQFAWNVHYPGADGQFGRTSVTLIDPGNPLGLDRQSPYAADDVVTINQLALPVDRPAIVQLSARDMIHSFGVPAMRVKQDAIPGMMIPVWFTPTVTGDFDIACSQLCGLGHYRMRGVVRVMAASEFQSWLGARQSSVGSRQSAVSVGSLSPPATVPHLD
jgi:cytochrome c oxidase subunit 2